ncbi:MAG TPA: hypothetical protein VFK92_01725 [Burkholderiales bacterium]|nr:hypothetical protein [Burkholderiales bacterium]
MKSMQRFLAQISIPAFFAAALAMPLAAVSAPSDEEIANGLDPLTTGQVVGSYPGGKLLDGEYFPSGRPSLAQATDEEIALGLDPITLGQEIGRFSGGTVLSGEYVPYRTPSDKTQTQTVAR